MKSRSKVESNPNHLSWHRIKIEWTWVNLIELDWTWLDLIGLDWTWLDLIGLDWTWLNLIELDWTWLNLIDHNQTGSNRIKQDQTRSKMLWDTFRTSLLWNHFGIPYMVLLWDTLHLEALLPLKFFWEGLFFSFWFLILNIWITFHSVKRLIKRILVPCLLSWDTKWIIYMSRLVSIFALLTWPRELMSHMCKPPIESMHLLEWLMLEMNGWRSGRSRIVLVKKVTRSKMQITIELKQLQILTVGPFWPQNWQTYFVYLCN